jgi:hypothetical protein
MSCLLENSNTKKKFLFPACQLWSESELGRTNFSVICVSMTDRTIQNEALTLFGCTFSS